jgi:hypothetical protein
MSLHQRLEILTESIRSATEAKIRKRHVFNHTGPAKFLVRMKKSVEYISRSLGKTALQINERADLSVIHDNLLRLSKELKSVMDEIEEKTKNHG